MNTERMILKDVEIVEVKVTRKGNLEEATYVGWKTQDGEAKNGLHFIRGEGSNS